MPRWVSAAVSNVCELTSCQRLSFDVSVVVPCINRSTATTCPTAELRTTVRLPRVKTRCWVVNTSVGGSWRRTAARRYECLTASGSLLLCLGFIHGIFWSHVSLCRYNVATLSRLVSPTKPPGHVIWLNVPSHHAACSTRKVASLVARSVMWTTAPTCITPQRTMGSNSPMFRTSALCKLARICPKRKIFLIFLELFVAENNFTLQT